MTEGSKENDSSEEKTILFEEALAIVDHALAGRVVAAETVPILESRGRFLAEAPHSRLELPPFNKSAMDGYAVMEGDRRDTYRVIESIPAGKTPTVPLTPGTASRVMTGAPVPEGAGKVVMFEKTDSGEETVRVFDHGGKSNICLKGEDIRIGQELLAPGYKLSALAVANLVACGVGEVSVRRPVRLAIISTGDELASSLDDVGPGKIMDSNGPALAGLAAEHHLELVEQTIVRDNLGDTTAAIRRAASLADVTVLSGGVSAGDYDVVPKAITRAGFTIHFDRVAVQPGKPLTFATDDGRVVVGLPGNPVSVFSGFHLIVLRAVRLLSGAAPGGKSFRIALAADYQRRRAHRAAFVPVRVNGDGCAEPIEYHGSAHLMALCEADGFLLIPLGAVRIAAGEKVSFFPLLM